MIYKESFKNFALAQDRLEHLLRLNPQGETAAPALYHLYKIDEKILPQKAKQYYNRIVTNHPDSPYAKILTNPEEFGQSDLQTPEKFYESLVKIYQKGDKISQLIFCEHIHPKIIAGIELESDGRGTGGFGSTGL